MHLNHVVGHGMQKIADLALGQGAHLCNVLTALINGRQRTFDTGPCKLHVHEMRGLAVTERLKRTNHLIKLHPGFQVFQRPIKCLRTGPQQFSSQPGAAAVKQGFQQATAFVDLAEHRISANADLVKPDVCITSRIHRRQWLAADAFGSRIDDEQCHPSFIAGITARSCRHQQHIRCRAFQDKILRS